MGTIASFRGFVEQFVVLDGSMGQRVVVPVRVPLIGLHQVDPRAHDVKLVRVRHLVGFREKGTAHGRSIYLMAHALEARAELRHQVPVVLLVPLLDELFEEHAIISRR